MASAAEQLASNLNWGSIGRATELKKRLWFTVAALVVFRIGAYIPVPGVDPAALAEIFKQNAGGIAGLLDVFSGGSIGRMSVLALSIMPYISASIIMQILTTVVPSLEALKKEGEAGRKKINQYTRYGTVILATFQAYGIAVGLESQVATAGPVVIDPGVFFRFVTIITLVGGTLFLMWLGEQITARGVGNGVSLIIFAGIVAALPGRAGADPRTRPDRRAVGAVHHRAGARHRAGRGGRRLRRDARSDESSSSIPSARSATACMAARPRTCRSRSTPPASSRRSSPRRCCCSRRPSRRSRAIPASRAGCSGSSTYLGHGQPLYLFAYIGLIVFFCFFYTTVVFNPADTADNLKKNGGFIPGIRPGKNTAEYLEYILNRLTVIGALYLSAVCILPELLIARGGVPFYFGGTSLLIVVSVTLDTVTQVQSHLLAHQYEGLIKKARLRGKGR